MTNFNINEAGYVIIGLFLAVSMAAVTYWRIAGIETRWAANAKSVD